MSGKHSYRRILVVGEGRETEYNYFVGLRNAASDILDATATSLRVVRGRGGDARGIVEHAVKERRSFEPDRRRGDRVFLVMDTEGDGRAPELPAAERLAEKHGIEIVFSSPSLEYWFRCHFPQCPRGFIGSCAAVVSDLNNLWGTVSRADYSKSDKDIYPRLSAHIELAREQALRIDLAHIQQSGSARRRNPSTQIYELVAMLLGARSGTRCPISGVWSLVANRAVTAQIQKGDVMPNHSGGNVLWSI